MVRSEFRPPLQPDQHGQSIGVMILLSSRSNRYSRGHVEFLRESSIRLD